MNRRVGNRNEERACYHYHHQGYRVWSPTWGGRGHGTFRSSDILWVFDFMATNEQEIIFGQVKTGSGFRNKVIEEMLETPLPNNCIREYWLFKPNTIMVRRLLPKGVIEYEVEE